MFVIACFLFGWSFSLNGSWYLYANILHQNFLRFTPPPPPPMRCCRSDWPGLCLICCYPFCFINFPIYPTQMVHLLNGLTIIFYGVILQYYSSLQDHKCEIRGSTTPLYWSFLRDSRFSSPPPLSEWVRCGEWVRFIYTMCKFFNFTPPPPLSPPPGCFPTFGALFSYGLCWPAFYQGGG